MTASTGRSGLPHAATGNRAKAVAAYHEFRELLAEEVGTDPASETQELYREILD